jgi:hypothetical protein
MAIHRLEMEGLYSTGVMTLTQVGFYSNTASFGGLYSEGMLALTQVGLYSNTANLGVPSI